MAFSKGFLIISLDFELYWGVREKRSIRQYGNNLRGAHDAVHEILSVFGDFHIHATWATVGFLFCANRAELLQNIPQQLPDYSESTLSPYKYIDKSAYLEKKCHFAPQLIETIRKSKGQEIGTHTLSHYYCLEKGQNADTFREDLFAAVALAKKKDIRLRSLVFPRNQSNKDYLSVLREAEIDCYRGNADNWLYKAVKEKNQGKLKRAVRLLDAYINLSGHQTYGLHQLGRQQKPFNIPLSRFLRPYSKSLSFFDGLRLRRITRAMRHAAINNEMFHLCWHPHNFGINTGENILFLRKILAYFQQLRKQYAMISVNMDELTTYLEELKK